MYVMNSGVGQSEGLCPAAPTMCFRSKNAQDTARGFCQSGYVPDRAPGPCPDQVIAGEDVYRLRPCDIAHFNLCSAQEDPSGDIAFLQDQQRFGAQAVEENGEAAANGEEDDYTMYYVLGGLGILAVGGIAYFMTKKK